MFHLKIARNNGDTADFTAERAADPTSAIDVGADHATIGVFYLPIVDAIAGGNERYGGGFIVFTDS
jgi:hypothetical protein